jgi:hypothetical protein
MGIRLACPNGHKLHVKEFLAGKRGVCPECGATVVIPGTAAESSATANPSDAEVAPLTIPSAVGEPAPRPINTLTRRRVGKGRPKATLVLLAVVVVLALVLIWVLQRGAGQRAGWVSDPIRLAPSAAAPYVAGSEPAEVRSLHR